MSTRNLPGGKARPARKSDKPPSASRVSIQCGNLDVSQPYRPPRPVIGTALLFTTNLNYTLSDDVMSKIFSIPPLWSSGQSSWLQIRMSRVRFPTLQKEIVGLERGPLSLVSTTEELLGRISSGSGLESREYGRRDFFFYYSYIYRLASG
jgi:hypothetical protein